MTTATRMSRELLKVFCVQLAMLAAGAFLLTSVACWAKDGDGMVLKADSVAARLGGFPGICALVRDKAEPAQWAASGAPARFGRRREAC